MPLSIAEYIAHVADSGLMSPAEIEAFVRQLPPMQRPADGHQLARLLMQKKQLTAYQARAIYQGKGRALTLGKYVILGKLGQGGMGIVFRAQHRQMKRLVALKVLSASGRRVPSSSWRFRREVRAAGLLQHPNIVSAYDADVADGVEFLVLEFVDGVSLSQLVKERGPLPIAMAISCILQAAHGLEYAHSRGVVHRDIKPGNLLLGHDGILKVLDMGLARLEPQQFPSGDGESTGTGEIMGTADYMAPEQAAHMSLSDARADIYSLGCTLWYLLTGREPYPGANRMEKLVGHWEHPIPSLSAARSEAAALEATLTKMLAKKPEDRHQTMTEVITDLERCRTAEAAAGSHTPEPAEDRGLLNFLQALPELPTDREFRNSVRIHVAAAATEAATVSGTHSGSAQNAGSSSADRSQATFPQRVVRRLQVVRQPRLALAAAGAALLLAVILAGLHDWSRGYQAPLQLIPAAEPPTVPPPKVTEDWTPLLNGADLTGWRAMGRGSWSVAEGPLLVGRGADGWLVTETADYQDFELSVHYRLAEGGESGIFLRCWHQGEPQEFLELQIASEPPDGSRTPPDQKTGALVDIAAPARQVPAAPLKWHHVIARVKGTHVEVWFDGRRVTAADLSEANLQRPAVHTLRCGCIGLEIGRCWVEFRDIRLRRIPPETTAQQRASEPAS